ncbi:hypothetical protein [Hyphomonas oceanitis]|uniref:hypothetical protein n=1 Tax=Hyphomonas oceanitis TaxID=81033 RepID=UPI0030035555
MTATRIFIVEDEAILLCDLEDIVTHLGYDLAGSATSLDEAMDKLKAVRSRISPCSIST